eukprot:SAG31_NODE_22501_length_524_cov_0.967059_1_plen_84_part_01
MGSREIEKIAENMAGASQWAEIVIVSGNIENRRLSRGAHGMHGYVRLRHHGRETIAIDPNHCFGIDGVHAATQTLSLTRSSGAY